MFNLTRQERQVILFLTSVALVGLGLNYCSKINSRVELMVKAGADIAKLDLNEVTPQGLYSSQLIPQKLAEKIISYRNEHGQFRSVDELKQVKGIGKYRLEKLKEIFFVE